MQANGILILLVSNGNRGQSSGKTAHGLGEPSAAADEVGKIRHGWLVRRSEPIAEIIPERYAEFGTGMHQAEESIAAISSCVAVRATADLALDDVTANVALGAIGVQRDLRPVEHGQQLGLVAAAGDRG